VGVFSPSSAYISFKYPDSMKDAPNVPFIDIEDYPVIPFIWDPSTKLLEYCVEKPDDVNLDLSIVQDAMDNLNAQLYSGDLSTTALYFTLNTQKKCKPDDLKIKFVQSRNSVKAPGYCVRKFINGTIYRPMVMYNGCDITLNVCALQTYASLYNVLMHELLHVVGLDHPDPPVDGSIISYGVKVNDSSLMNIIQDTRYAVLQPFDIMNMRFIALRDFPKSILPDPRMIASYIPKQNASEHVGGDEYRISRIMSVENCWISSAVSPTATPTATPSAYPSTNPSVRPTQRPSAYPSTNPSVRPTQRPSAYPSTNPTETPSVRPSMVTQSPMASSITQDTLKPMRDKRRNKKKRNNKKKNKDKFSNATISTIANPEIYIDSTTTNGSSLNISTEIQPDITVDLLDGDVNMKTIISPKIDIQGQARNYNIITQINPIISIKQRQSLVLPPPKQWDRYP